MSTLKSLVLSSVLISICSPAVAFEQNTCVGERLDWASGRTGFHIASNSFPAGSSMLQRVVDGIARVNQNPSRFRMTSNLGGNDVFFPNFRNEIYGTTGILLGGAPASTLYTAACWNFLGIRQADLIEADILFDYSSPRQWTASNNKVDGISYGGPLRPILPTLLHELGHTFPVAHNSSIYNIMGQDFTFLATNGSTIRPYIGEDAANALMAIYGPSTTSFEDVSVSHWKWVGSNGGYSTHGRTAIYNQNMTIRPSATIDNEPGYVLSRGRVFRTEVTLENNGRSTQNVNVGIYLSRDTTITGGDRLLSTIPVALTRSVPSTILIPAILSPTLPAGNYSIGIFIDYDRAVSENIESNNKTYIPVRVE